MMRLQYRPSQGLLSLFSGILQHCGRHQCMNKMYLNLILCFRMCSIQASMKAVIVILSAWIRASSDNGATPSKT